MQSCKFACVEIWSSQVQVPPATMGDKNLHLAPHPGPNKVVNCGTCFSLGMGKTTGCAVLCQDIGGTSSTHTRVEKCMPVLLQVLGLAPGVCLGLAQDFSELALGGSLGWRVWLPVAAPYICPFVCMCICWTCSLVTPIVGVYPKWPAVCQWEESPPYGS